MKQLIALLSLGLAALPLQAQVGKLTEAEVARRGSGASAATNTVQPSKDPRDFTGSYRSAQFGAPGSGGMAAGGGGPPAGYVPPTGPYTSANCVPGFTVFGGGPDGPTRVIQTATQLALVSEEMHQVRRIYIDQEHPKNFPGSYSGDSVAHWEGDVLVVDTIGIKKVGAETAPASRMTERIRKLENGALENTITTYSGNNTQGVTRTSTLNFTGNQKVLEWICEDLGDVYFNEAIKL